MTSSAHSSSESQTRALFTDLCPLTDPAPLEAERRVLLALHLQAVGEGSSGERPNSEKSLYKVACRKEQSRALGSRLS